MVQRARHIPLATEPSRRTGGVSKRPLYRLQTFKLAKADPGCDDLRPPVWLGIARAPFSRLWPPPPCSRKRPASALVAPTSFKPDAQQKALPPHQFRKRIHRRHQREAARGVGWTEEGHCHCSAQCLGAAAVVEAGRMAAPWLGGLAKQVVDLDTGSLARGGPAPSSAGARHVAQIALWGLTANYTTTVGKAAVANHSTSTRRIFLSNVVRDRFLDWISSWILGSLAPRGSRASQLSFKPAS